MDPDGVAEEDEEVSFRVSPEEFVAAWRAYKKERKLLEPVQSRLSQLERGTSVKQTPSASTSAPEAADVARDEMRARALALVADADALLPLLPVTFAQEFANIAASRADRRALKNAVLREQRALMARQKTRAACELAADLAAELYRALADPQEDEGVVGLLLGKTEPRTPREALAIVRQHLDPRPAVTAKELLQTPSFPGPQLLHKYPYLEEPVTWYAGDLQDSGTVAAAVKLGHEKVLRRVRASSWYMSRLSLASLWLARREQDGSSSYATAAQELEPWVELLNGLKAIFNAEEMFFGFTAISKPHSQGGVGWVLTALHFLACGNTNCSTLVWPDGASQWIPHWTPCEANGQVEGRNFVASVAALGLESLGKDPADGSSQHVDAEQLQGLHLQPNNPPAQTPRPSLVDDDKERFLTNRALYRRELFSNMPMFFAKCLTWPIVPSMVGGSIQLALDRALPMPGHRPFPAWLAFGRVYMFFALQCPFQALHRRHSAWHWFAAGGMVGAFDYRMNNASFVHQFLRLTEYEEIQKTAKKGDWRYLLRYVHGVHLSFFAYGCGAALLGRFAGVPW
eukprot:g10286.t1